MVQLKPFRAVTGETPFWQAHASEPWLEIDLECPSRGGWLALAWHSSLSGPVCRPQLRMEQGETCDLRAEAYSLLAAAPLGGQDAVVYVPPGTTRLLVSPHDRPGAFAFRLARAQWMGLAEALRLGLLRRPLVAMHALGAASIGRPMDFRWLLMEALNALPLSRYATWRRRKLRAPDWTGLDAFATDDLPHLHVFVEEGCEGLTPARWPQGACVTIRPWPEAFSGVNGMRDLSRLDLVGGLADTDLFMFLPRGTRLAEAAIPALLSRAAADPEPAFFYGDEDLIDPPHGITLCPYSGFDPLSTFQRLSESVAIAFRAGKLRGMLSQPSHLDRLCGQPLWRPLVTRRTGSHPALASKKLLERLALTWPLATSPLATSPPATSPLATSPLATSPLATSPLATSPLQKESTPVQSEDIAVIIPTRDRLPLLRACLDTVRPTLPHRAEVIIVDNDSSSPDTMEFLDDLRRQDQCKVVRVAGAFNFSKLCNHGASATEKRLLIFLNNDTTIVAADWWMHLEKWALQPDIGAVGARLLYPSGRVQHSGVIIGLGGFAGHIDLNIEAKSTGTFGRALSTHALLAVTGACLAVEKAKFDEVGGFDAVNLPIELNDIDLCLRLGERGFRTVISSEAVLVHHESASRGRGGSADRYRAEKAYFVERWKDIRRRDPFWHPALSLMSSRGLLG